MGTLVLKSTNNLESATVESYFEDYKSRVLSEGGEIFDEQDVKDTLSFLVENNLTSVNIGSVTSPNWGVKKTSTGAITKLFSLINSKGDLLLKNQEIDRIYKFVDNGKQLVRFFGIRNIANNSVFYSKGTYSAKSNTLSLVCCKPYQNSDYSISLGGGLFRIMGWGNESLQRHLEVQYNSPSTDINAWGLQFRSHGTVVKPTIDSVAVMPSGFTSLSFYVKDDTTKAFNGSGLVAQGKGYSVHNNHSDMSIYVGNMVQNKEMTDNPSMLRADLAEMWFLADVDESLAQTLSSRVDAKYNA